MKSPLEPKWLESRLILAAQARQIELFGGADGIRDVELVHSAIARPQQLFNYGDPPPDIYALAASYAFGLAKNHAFLDGNKRIAHVAYRTFLLKNDYTCNASLEDKYTKMIELASSKISEEDFAQWLREACSKVC